ncbi:hypothetical protein M422DRAFT_243670 [Sphaerobolus stellatus SS14]|nr:hypothetical protein M422DRAFT_243670 [Sphaerobolus stellatus SS14]
MSPLQHSHQPSHRLHHSLGSNSNQDSLAHPMRTQQLRRREEVEGREEGHNADVGIEIGRVVGMETEERGGIVRGDVEKRNARVVGVAYAGDIQRDYDVAMSVNVHASYHIHQVYFARHLHAKPHNLTHLYAQIDVDDVGVSHRRMLSSASSIPILCISTITMMSPFSRNPRDRKRPHTFYTPPNSDLGLLCEPRGGRLEYGTATSEFVGCDLVSEDEHNGDDNHCVDHVGGEVEERCWGGLKARGVLGCGRGDCRGWREGGRRGTGGGITSGWG